MQKLINIWERSLEIVCAIFIILFFIILMPFQTFLPMIYKFPLRFICKRRKDHDWICHGTGGWITPAPKWQFSCKTCGIRSRGDWDELERKGFKGQARFKI